MKVELNLCFGVGLCGQWKKFTTHPPNYVQNHHFQRQENTNFIFLKSECLHLPLTNITGHFRNPKDFSNYQNLAKTDFTQDPPPPLLRPSFFGRLCLIFQPIFLKKVSNWSGTHTASSKTCPLRFFETSPFFSPSIAHHYPEDDKWGFLTSKNHGQSL